MKYTEHPELTKEQLDKFYQVKYDNYKKITQDSIILVILGIMIFWISGFVLDSDISLDIIFPRFSLILLIYPYIKITNKYKYKVNLTVSYIVIYLIGILSIWAINEIQNYRYASDIFLIIQLACMVFGAAAPRMVARAAHFGIVIEFLICCLIINSSDTLILVALQLIVYLIIEGILNTFESNFLAHYLSRTEAESALVHDQLTGAYNRNKMKELCKNDSTELKIERASIIMIDMDFFKQVNDTYGHEKGDMVLKNLVSIVKENVRRTDYVIRWGGEEFIIIMTNCPELKAKEIAERIREAVIDSGDNMCNHTVSLGISSYSGGDYNESVRNADKALYYAKEHGRNQVVLASEIE